MNMRPFETMRWGVWLTVVLAILGVTPADAAEDGKNYPGSMCIRWSGGSPSYAYSSIGNPSAASDLKVDCPVVKDGIAENIKSGWVRVTDRHTTRNISCTLVSVYRADNGAVVDEPFGPVESTRGGDNFVVEQLEFGGLATNPLAHYYYSCTIPPAQGGRISQIHTYQVHEYD
jgi:hypothetical protein